jgi:sulfate adenylyltransferase
MKLISPHGGTLVNRVANQTDVESYTRQAVTLPSLILSSREASDLELIAIGAYSPIDGFMGKADYESVRDNLRLSDGTVWPLPVTLSATEEQALAFREGEKIALYAASGSEGVRGELLGILDLQEKYTYDKTLEAEQVYLTKDSAHPGVQVLYERGDWLLSGPITLVNPPSNVPFAEYRLTPSETRQLFVERKWRRVVAFQTRNPVHRAHEYIQKCALEIADGLLLHPVVGDTKSDDVPADVRMRSYEAILSEYYPANRTQLAVLPVAMRYAGPREAVFHALIRKNYGCSYFIVGRDHAGVGNYYGTYDAHRIFDQFSPDEIGITPLFFDHTFYCTACSGMASSKTCPHDSSRHVTLSGTKVRELLTAGTLPPIEFSRPEVASVLIEAYRAINSQAVALV